MPSCPPHGPAPPSESHWDNASLRILLASEVSVVLVCTCNCSSQAKGSLIYNGWVAPLFQSATEIEPACLAMKRFALNFV